jgi:hypothetical protein
MYHPLRYRRPAEVTAAGSEMWLCFMPVMAAALRVKTAPPKQASPLRAMMTGPERILGRPPVREPVGSGMKASWLVGFLTHQATRW